jgi:PIN domain nuclease of toxin-antitoxin system
MILLLDTHTLLWFLQVLPHHHKDPFDRLLVAQALAEGISIVSSDVSLDPYGVKRLW